MKSSIYKSEKVDGIDRYYTKAFDEWVEITKEVYEFMVSNDRHMRYLCSRDAAQGCISLEAIRENAEGSESSAFIEHLPCTPAPDDSVLDTICGTTDEFLLSVIKAKIESLIGVERILAMEIFINGRSMVEYSNAIRVSRKTLMKKVHRVSKMIRNSCMKELSNRYEG